MLIDWFTVAAQIINFLVLIWLLRRFLYRPIVRIMSEREAKIAAQLTEAQYLQQQAIDEAENYRQQQQALQNRKDELLAEIKAEVEAQRKELIDKVRREIDESRANWRESVEAEKQAFMREVRQQIGTQVCAISRRALADLADADLEQQVIAAFIQHMQNLDGELHERLAQSANNAEHKASLHSAFEISPAAREDITKQLQRVIGSEFEIEFAVMPELLCGVEVSIHDYKLGWTLDEYLASLEKDLTEALSMEVEYAHAE